MITYRLCFLGFQLLIILNTTQAVIKLKANPDDIKSLAQKLLTDSLSDKLVEIFAKSQGDGDKTLTKDNLKNQIGASGAIELNIDLGKMFTEEKHDKNEEKSVKTKFIPVSGFNIGDFRRKAVDNNRKRNGKAKYRPGSVDNLKFNLMKANNQFHGSKRAKSGSIGEVTYQFARPKMPSYVSRFNTKLKSIEEPASKDKVQDSDDSSSGLKINDSIESKPLKLKDLWIEETTNNDFMYRKKYSKPVHKTSIANKQIKLENLEPAKNADRLRFKNPVQYKQFPINKPNLDERLKEDPNEKLNQTALRYLENHKGHTRRPVHERKEYHNKNKPQLPASKQKDHVVIKENLSKEEKLEASENLKNKQEQSKKKYYHRLHRLTYAPKDILKLQHYPEHKVYSPITLRKKVETGISKFGRVTERTVSSTLNESKNQNEATVQQMTPETTKSKSEIQPLSGLHRNDQANVNAHSSTTAKPTIVDSKLSEIKITESTTVKLSELEAQETKTTPKILKNSEINDKVQQNSQETTTHTSDTNNEKVVNEDITIEAGKQQDQPNNESNAKVTTDLEKLIEQEASKETEYQNSLYSNATNASVDQELGEEYDLLWNKNKIDNETLSSNRI